MKIEDLDEFEGLTADMVRDWLRAKGCIFDGTWALPDRPTPYYWDGQLLCSGTLGHIAHDFGYPSLQSLLREINPRMRPGWPTDEELGRHEFWIVRTLSDDGIRVLGSYLAFEWKRAGIKAECWPCDAHGNKVRRGTVAQR